MSGWDLLDRDSTSTKEGVWLAEPDTQVRWLYKPAYREIQQDAAGNVRAERLHGDDWAEVVAGAVGRSLGIPVAPCQLAVRQGHPGVASRSFLDADERLEHGHELLSGLDPTYPGDRVREVPGYTVERVLSALEPIQPPHGTEDWLANAAEAFVGYLVLDAVIANQDRHHSNWAVITDAAGGQRLAPAYDQAASLGHQAPGKEERLAENTVTDWVVRGRSNNFEGKHQLIVLARSAAAHIRSEVAAEWRGRVESFAVADVTDTLDAVPAERLSQVDRTFAEEVIRLNGERLLDGWQ